MAARDKAIDFQMCSFGNIYEVWLSYLETMMLLMSLSLMVNIVCGDCCSWHVFIINNISFDI